MVRWWDGALSWCRQQVLNLLPVFIDLRTWFFCTRTTLSICGKMSNHFHFLWFQILCIFVFKDLSLRPIESGLIHRNTTANFCHLTRRCTFGIFLHQVTLLVIVFSIKLWHTPRKFIVSSISSYTIQDLSFSASRCCMIYLSSTASQNLPSKIW